MEIVPPSGIDLSESRQPSVLGAYVSTLVLAILAVALRTLCRVKLSRAGLWWDDWLVLVAMIPAIVFFAILMIGLDAGLGTHIYLHGAEGPTRFLRVLFMNEIVYSPVIALVKFSILMFYVRIFTWWTMRIPVYMLGTVTLAGGISGIFVTTFQCYPVHAFWDKTVENASCSVDSVLYLTLGAVVNIVTDWALLVLPLPHIWRLQRDIASRVALSGVFLLGSFIGVVSVVRLVLLRQTLATRSLDLTWIYTDVAIWTEIELNIGIVSACMPSLRPILKVILRLLPGKTSEESDSDHPPTIGRAQWRRRNQDSIYRSETGVESLDSRYGAEAHYGVEAGLESQDSGYGMGAISVGSKTEIKGVREVVNEA